MARFIGVLLLVAVGYLHLLDISHKVDEGIWYMVLLFAALIAGSILLSVALVRLAPEQVRLAWMGALLLAAGALFGYTVSRILPLPGMADHQGDWINLYGVFAAIVEVGLFATAVWAMRNLTIRGVSHDPPSALRLPLTAGLNAILLLALLPGQAFGHGGEDDEAAAAAVAPAGSGAGGGAGKGDGAQAATMPGEHGDPFLGTPELGLALLASLGFIVWAGRSLATRADLAGTPPLSQNARRG
ncbi:MAG: hypothetical protein ACERKT_07595 [Acidobacteriota bacterium]